jgi:hypothetical protein
MNNFLTNACSFLKFKMLVAKLKHNNQTKYQTDWVKTHLGIRGVDIFTVKLA